MSALAAADMPPVVDRASFETQLGELRVREKAHIREGDAIAAARRRLPMVEVGASTRLIGTHGPVSLLDVFEGRRQLLVGRQVGLVHLVSYLRHDDQVFETYWTTRRGVEAMDYSYALMDLTVYGRQVPWEDSPPGWPQEWQVNGSNTRTNGCPIAQWSRLEAGRSDDLTATREMETPR